MRSWLPEVAHWVGLLPLAFLLTLRLAGRPRDRAYLWLAVAFAVSFVSDSLAHHVDAWLLSSVYPVTQAALIGAVLLARKDAWLFLLVLVNAGIVAALFAGPWPDLLLHTVAFGGVTAIVYDRHYLGFVRTALLAYCGLGLAAWYWFALAPSFTHYAVYQATRIVGLAWFCMACLHPAPKLRVT